MSLASRTPGILIFLPPKTPIEFQLVLWVWNQRKSMSEGWHSFKCGMICTVYELEIVNGGGVGGQKMTKTCQRSFWAAINNQKQLWRRLHFPFIFSEEAKILLKAVLTKSTYARVLVFLASKIRIWGERFFTL